VLHLLRIAVTSPSHHCRIVLASFLYHRRIAPASTSHQRRIVLASSSHRRRIVLASMRLRPTSSAMRRAHGIRTPEKPEGGVCCHIMLQPENGKDGRKELDVYIECLRDMFIIYHQLSQLQRNLQDIFFIFSHNSTYLL
jgi:hypothetical protein